VSGQKPLPPDVLELGLGLLSIGRVWGDERSEPPSEQGAEDLLRQAIELGVTVFDTAPAYGTSEARLGRFLNGLGPGRRTDLVVMTKAGEHCDSDRGTSFVDHSRDALCRSIDRSLALLGRIDVLQIHKATREVVRDAGVMAALEYARACGIATFGASVSDEATGVAALETGAYDALQFPLNIADRSLAPLLTLLEETSGTAIINRPFAMGGLLRRGADTGAHARAAFRLLRETVYRGVVLTGTGKAAHLAENVEAFRTCEAPEARSERVRPA